MKIKNDLILIFSIIALSVLLIAAGRALRTPGQVCEITVDGEEYAVLSLSDDCTVDVGGRCVIEISGGKARFLSSECREKICVNHSPIGSAGETAICAPEGVSIRILGGSGPDFVQ